MYMHARIQRGGGGTGGPDPPPWNLKILPKKRYFRDFWGVGPPLVCDQKLPFSLDPPPPLMKISGSAHDMNGSIF